MELIIAAALQLLTRHLEAARTHLELRDSREKDGRTAGNHRPKHLREWPHERGPALQRRRPLALTNGVA
jgi:hypothetical protein